MSLIRRLGNGVFVALVRMLFGARYSDLCYGYNAFRARALPLLSLDRDGFEIETLLNIRALRAGLRVAEVPSFEARRVHGEGRLRTIPDGWRVLCTIWREWRATQREGLLGPAPVVSSSGFPGQQGLAPGQGAGVVRPALLDRWCPVRWTSRSATSGFSRSPAAG